MMQAIQELHRLSARTRPPQLRTIPPTETLRNISSSSSNNNNQRKLDGCPTREYTPTWKSPQAVVTALIGMIRSSVSSSSQPQASYTDALDASRGMVALSQDLTTPRNIYGMPPRSDRGSTDGYGFPTSHSAHSSISSASYNPSYYSGSVDSSVSDYGSASDMESVNSRTIPRPSGLMSAGGSGLPPPQSMMGQFNSKVSSSTQKKHKCKICDKRFTRPSSLQTHMFSHTGEKPFACEADGCGRHFSVVSNLRRHRKVHKGDHRASDHESPEGSWASDK